MHILLLYSKFNPTINNKIITRKQNWIKNEKKKKDNYAVR